MPPSEANISLSVVVAGRVVRLDACQRGAVASKPSLATPSFRHFDFSCAIYFSRVPVVPPTPHRVKSLTKGICRFISRWTRFCHPHNLQSEPQVNFARFNDKGEKPAFFFLSFFFIKHSSLMNLPFTC